MVFPVINNYFPMINHGFPVTNNYFPMINHDFPAINNYFPMINHDFPVINNYFPITMINHHFPVINHPKTQLWPKAIWLPVPTASYDDFDVLPAAVAPGVRTHLMLRCLHGQAASLDT